MVLIPQTHKIAEINKTIVVIIAGGDHICDPKCQNFNFRRFENPHIVRLRCLNFNNRAIAVAIKFACGNDIRYLENNGGNNRFFKLSHSNYFLGTNYLAMSSRTAAKEALQPP